MKIGLINENSQATKNSIIYNSLLKVCNEKDYTLYNFGMTSNEDESLTYVEAGLLAAILLNTQVVDFIVTGCGTGQGAMLALNSFPNVECGLITDPTDAFLFSQINAGNAISIPYAKGFGWGSEVTLDYIFEKLFSCEFGGGYPIERREPEQKNKKILDEIKKVTHQDILTILKNIDQDFLYETVNRQSFKEIFFNNAEDSEIKDYLHNICFKK